MTASPFDSAIYGGLLGDAEIGSHFSDAAEIRAMLRVEGALAKVQGALGIIPAESADAIARAAETVAIDPAHLAKGTASDGMAVPALVEAFRAAIGAPGHARFVHWGATSQDIVDTGLLLRLRPVLAILDGRLGQIIASLGQKAEAHRQTVLAARTRSQMATPTTLGAKIAVWAAPLLRHRERLAELRPRLLVVSLAGASGTLAAMEGRGIATMEALAAELGLGAPDVPWHAARDGIAELAGLLALITGSLGKIGQDLILLSQSEIREVRAGEGGGSSTMPHKSNPVRAEMLVALARLASRLSGAVQEGLIHAQEREGAALALEWLALPQLCLAAGAATGHALALAETISADPARMGANIAATQDLMLAEAASFALASHMPRPQAQALVKAACQRAVAEDRPLRAVLPEMTDAPLDWDRVFDPAAYTGEAAAFVDRFLARLSRP
ncbi:MAG TPA: 3-carboxy-cis,cis-muconate cycloisomerase [Paracoccaceae bacterium]|nr:3-carboxy-cis,cis-muconate cycloisomerase [Paracoccaceae bacterium]